MLNTEAAEVNLKCVNGFISSQIFHNKEVITLSDSYGILGISAAMRTFNNELKLFVFVVSWRQQMLSCTGETAFWELKTGSVHHEYG